jgi:hypothetical protein
VVCSNRTHMLLSMKRAISRVGRMKATTCLSTVNPGVDHLR